MGKLDKVLNLAAKVILTSAAVGIYTRAVGIIWRSEAKKVVEPKEEKETPVK